MKLINLFAIIASNNLLEMLEMKKTKLFMALFTLGFTSLSVQAAPSSYSPIGPNIGYGDASNPHTIYSTLANPANNALSTSTEEGSRFGLGVSAQFQVELAGLEGSVNYFDNHIEPLLNSNNAADLAILQTNINTYLTRHNQGNFSSINSINVPILVRTDLIGGGITFDYTRQTASKGTIIRNNDVTALLGGGGNVTINPGAAGLGLNHKELSEFSLGYGRNFMTNESGTLSAGLSARHLSLVSNTRALDFKTIVDDNVGGQERTASDYLDGMDSGTADSNFTADIGINWTAQNYMIGFTAMNLTEPTFDITDRSTGAASVDFRDFIQPTYTLKSQYRVSGQLFSDNRHWKLGGSIDLAQANDLNNKATQWWTLGAAFATDSAWYIPDARFGLRSNMAGSQQTYMNAGVTLGFLNLDLATTTLNLNDVANDQKDAAVMGSAGVEFSF